MNKAQQQVVRSSLAGWLEPVLVAGLALSVYLATIGSGHPQSDEVFHLLAARSWLADGTLWIGINEYTRAAGYTIALAEVFSVFGDSETVARAFSAVLASLWVVALFLWVRHVAGRLAAWLAAMLFCLSPHTLFLAHFIRFYALHGLAFFLGATGFYFLLTARFSVPATVGLLAGVVVCFALALHLQLTTLIGLVGLAVWAVVARQAWIHALLRRMLKDPRLRPWLWVSAGLVVLGGILVVRSGIVEYLLEFYLSAQIWNVANEYNILFYHYLFVKDYPALWALLPLAALVAIVQRPRPALFCTCLFGVAVVLHSLAGPKLERYLHYALPFFFGLWGIALAEAAPRIRGLAGQAVERVFNAGDWRRFRAGAGWTAMVVVFMFFLASNLAYKTAGKMLESWPHIESDPTSSWRQARGLLQPWLDKASVVLTTNPIHAVYYFGGFDIAVAKAYVQATIDGKEFGEPADWSFRSISTAESFRLVLSCYPSGLFVGTPSRWGHPLMGIPEESAEFLMTHAERIAVPDGWDLIAYRWERPDGPAPPECSSLPSFSAAPSTGPPARHSG